MKKLISPISLIILCTWLVSCGHSLTNQAKEPIINPVKQSPSSASPQVTASVLAPGETSEEPVKHIPTENPIQPEVGTVKELVNGDLLCYVTLIDTAGTERHVGAAFDICAEQAKYLNQKVHLSYHIESVNDCQSAEPCGKTKKESIITKIEVLAQKNTTKSSPSDSETLSNGEWTITVGNGASWTGVNGTGNLTYSGCDAQKHCLQLTGGKVSCRDGKCSTGWSKGDYVYILEEDITESGNDAQNKNRSSTLTVMRKSNVILTVKELKAIPSN